MSKEDLIHSAGHLAAPDVATSLSLREKAGEMARELTQRMKRREDLEDLVGRGNQAVMEANHVNHFQYIASLAALYEPVSFVETVIWVLRTYMGRGFTPRYWQVMLPEAQGILRESLPPDQSRQAEAIYSWLLEHIPDFVDVSARTVSFYESLSPLQGVMDDVGR